LRKALAHLGHRSHQDFTLAGGLLKDVRRKAAAHSDGNRGNTELTAQPIKLVLLHLAATVGPGAPDTTEGRIVVTAAARTPCGGKAMSTLFVHTQTLGRMCSSCAIADGRFELQRCAND
jgi:hypothetical protein